MKFTIDAKVFEMFEDYCVAIVLAKRIDNSVKKEEISELMKERQELLHEQLGDKNIRELDEIRVFRDAFTKLGMNPNKFMCSIEALSKRVQKGNPLPNINSIVDIGNVISLKYLIPAGAHDVDKMNDEEFSIRFSTAEDTFLPMGESEAEIMPEGEMIYVSKNTVKTRKWTWRQSEDGKIDEGTSYVFFPLDGFKGVTDEAILKAQSELAELLKKYFNAEVTIGFVDREHPCFEG